MADSKISALSSATTPLAGTELVPIVQGGSTVSVASNQLGVILKSVVTLTDAQFRGMHTTPITLVANPGAGLYVQPIFVLLKLDSTAGAYSADTTDGDSIFVSSGGLGFLDLANSTDLGNLLSSFITAGGIRHVVMPAVSEFSRFSTDFNATLPNFVTTLTGNHAMTISASAVFTGGNAANTLTVTSLYTILST